MNELIILCIISAMMGSGATLLVLSFFKKRPTKCGYVDEVSLIRGLGSK